MSSTSVSHSQQFPASAPTTVPPFIFLARAKILGRRARARGLHRPRRFAKRLRLRIRFRLAALRRRHVLAQLAYRVAFAGGPAGFTSDSRRLDELDAELEHFEPELR